MCSSYIGIKKSTGSDGAAEERSCKSGCTAPQYAVRNKAMFVDRRAGCSIRIELMEPCGA